MSDKKVEVVKVKRNKNNIEYSKTTVDSYFYLNGSGESYGAVPGERLLTHSFLMDSFRKLMGRTLTIIDASVHEEIQNKAMKDLVRNVYSDEMEFASDWAFDQEILVKMGEENFEELSDEEMENSAVTIEEALGVN
jgi:hypothetical protein